ncbi:MAG: cysteine hydrolase family protein [Candidatus Hodarchaeota archaeon]
MHDSALLIMDMQLGNFLDPNPIYNGNDLISKIKSLIIKMRSAQGLIIYIQNSGGKGDPDEFGTPGWKIHPAIAPRIGDQLIEKRTPDAFHETNLQELLDSYRIKEVIIAGLQTEYCIDTTCRSACSRGFKVILVKDGHSTWDSSHLTAQQIIDHHNDVLGGWFVTLKPEIEILSEVSIS